MDNNNNNKEFEKLFYKVFHNKYIFNLIIHHIQTTEWIKYENINDYNLYNRRRFKDIISLEFMIEKKLFSLLELKLKANEYILLDSNLEWINQLENKKEIFQYFLNNSSIKNHDFINQNLVYLDQDLIEIAINEPYSFQILISTLTSVMNENEIPSERMIYLIESFFKYNQNNQLLINEGKKQLIDIIFQKITCVFIRDQLLEFIFKNNYFNKDYINKDEVERIFYTNSINVQNKLLDIYYSKQSIDLEKEDMKIKISNFIEKNKSTRENIKYYQIFYQNFLKNVENLKSFLSNNPNNFKCIGNNILSYLCHVSIGNNIEVINYYINIENGPKEYLFFKNKIMDRFFINKITKYLKSNQYQVIKDIIEPTTSTDNNIIQIFKKILDNSILHPDYLIINKMEILELVLELPINFLKGKIVLSSLELIKHCISKGKCKKDDISIYIYMILNSIDNLDINKFKSIEKFLEDIDIDLNKSINILISEDILKKKKGIYKYINRDKPEEIITNEDNKSSENISKIQDIIEYLVSNDYSWYLVIYCLGLLYSYSNNKEHCKVIINNNNKIKWLIFFKNSLVFSSKIILEIIFNSFNPILEFQNDHYISYDIDLEFLFEKSFIKKDTNSNEIQLCIEFIINKYNNSISQDNDNDVVETIINLLFNNLLQCISVPIQQIIDVYKFINEKSNIKIKHTEEHSIVYLHFVSPKITLYFKSIPDFIVDTPQRWTVNEYFKNIFDSNKYSIENLFNDNNNLNENEIIDELFDQLFYKLINQKYKDFNEDDEIINVQTIIINNFQYLIAIKREDLFYNSFKFIQDLPFFYRLNIELTTCSISSIKNYIPEYIILLDTHENKETYQCYKEFDKIIEKENQQNQEQLPEFNCFWYENDHNFTRLIKYHKFYFTNNNYDDLKILQLMKFDGRYEVFGIPRDFYIYCLKNYPNFFQISSDLIENATKRNIYWIKYLNQNNIFNDDQKSLISQLLSNHKDLKFFNW